ncbi:hypothetical protein O3P69_016948 [Scylla paramamosain]|uniref:Uncharacterized protein n=1 Tax=Scylla paramamosain TaxID=85552 RepID=A0AAW0TTB6_SCYPA
MAAEARFGGLARNVSRCVATEPRGSWQRCCDRPCAAEMHHYHCYYYRTRPQTLGALHTTGNAGCLLHKTLHIGVCTSTPPGSPRIPPPGHTTTSTGRSSGVVKQAY